MINFEFATATRIVFGDGAITKAGAIAAGLGRRALLVTGKSPQRAESLMADLVGHGVTVVIYSVEKEPTVALARQGVELARESACDLVVGFGGGSAIDAGKAIAALLTNSGDPLDYLEVIGRNQALSQRSAPFLAIPTTAGTGAEVTRNAVLGSPEHGVKVSLRSPTMLPSVALIDPELTYSLPAQVTATTGFDALTQVIEPYVSVAANPLTDALCRDGILRGAASLRRVYAQPDDRAARNDMALTSLFGGLALANAKLGAVHGFAGPMGGMFDAAHGGICAALLPHVTTVNLRALRTRAPESPALRRYADVAAWLTGDATADAMAGADWLFAAAEELHIPKLRTYGLTRQHFPELIAKARKASSMQGNPILLSDDELNQILELAW